jgi:Xaa-Pro aminopeptidase
MHKIVRLGWIAALCVMSLVPLASSLDKQPSAVYRARREALGAKLDGGVAVLFAAEEAQVDFMPYRQDEDFYYLTGWNEPGAALVIVGDAPRGANPRAYSEILFLPTRDLRMEKYTGAKLDAASPGVAQISGVDAVKPMTELPAFLNRPAGAVRPLGTTGCSASQGIHGVFEGYPGDGRERFGTRCDEIDGAVTRGEGPRRD